MKGLNLNRIIRNIQGRRTNLLRRLGNNTLNMFQVRNFDAQGFINDGVDKWKPVLSKKPGQKIGIETGRMRRSGRSTVKNTRTAEVSFNAPYSSFFNKKRRLVGNSKTLNRENRTIITRHFNQIFR